MRIQLDRLKTIFRVEFACLACVLSALLFTPFVQCQTPEKDKKTPTPTPDKTLLPPKIQTVVEFGGQTRDIQGDHPAKFQEVRDVPKGFFVQNLKLDFKSADSPYFFTLRGLELRQLDQRYTAEGGKIGKYRTQFIWDQVPHSFGTGRSFLLSTAPGVYQVSATLRARLQTLTSPEARISPTSEVSNLIRQELQTAPVTEVRLRRDQALFRHSYQATDKVELHFQFSRLRTRGTRPMSVGSFVRRPVPAPGLADIGGLWEGIGQEFLEPLDYRTTDLRVGTQFTGKRWNAGVDYDLSFFRNRIGSLTFENPFRVTDEQGCTPNNLTTPPSLTCGASNRFRQVRWQSDLAPNNDSHTINVWANAELTPKTQLRGLFSLAYWTQNDAFLPWTLNTAIVPINWDGLSPIKNPTDVRELPAQSLNGKMRNINQEYALVNRSKNFRFQAQYRSQDLDTQSRLIDFPGYAAFGDSTWRAPRTDFYNLPIENLDWDFTRQNLSAGFQWKIFSPRVVLPPTQITPPVQGVPPLQNVLPRQDFLSHMTLRVDYEGEIWNRKFRDVNRNNEHSIRSRLDLDTTAGLRFKADYRYSNRRAQGYNTQPLTFCPANAVPNLTPLDQCAIAFGTGTNNGYQGAPASSPQGAWVVNSFTRMNRGQPIEFNLLRRFDQTDRTRNDGTFTIEFLPNSRPKMKVPPPPAAGATAAEEEVEPTPTKFSRTTFSATYRYLAEGYDQNLYGRTLNHLSFVDAQFSYTFLNQTFFFASYARETNRLRYRDLAHLLPNPAAPPGAIVQGVLAQFPIANTWERTSRSSLDNFEVGINAAPQQGRWQVDLSYAVSFARDRISTYNPYLVRADSILHAGVNPYPDTVVRRQDVNIAVSRRIREGLEIGMRYWYEPYMQDDFSFNTLQPYVHGTITSDVPKYLFQDARYDSYRSNVVTVFLRYSIRGAQ